MIKVMVVDDHRIVRTGIVRVLKDVADVEVVAEAESGEQAGELARERELDIVLMDVNMPGIGGLEATRRLLYRHPTFKIIALSMYADGPYPGLILKAGASGYLSKGTSAEEMVTAIRKVHAGGIYISPEVARSVLFSNGGFSDLMAQLSRREVQVLDMISKGHSTHDIARQLNLSQTTVRTHRRGLLEKLRVKNNVQLAMVARQCCLLDQARGDIIRPLGQSE